MTEKRRYCPKGHDTYLEGRSASYQCLRCKREAGAEARDRRRAEEDAARAADQVALNERVRRHDAEMRRRREKLAESHRGMKRAAQQRKNPL